MINESNPAIIFANLIEKKGSLLKPENEYGNIEYKLRLDAKNNLGLKKLASQMNWRLEEGLTTTGRKEAHYILGVNDNGTPGKLSLAEVELTYQILENIVKEHNATIIETHTHLLNDSHIMHIIIRKIEKTKINELSIGFIGPSQSGKTTTIAHLTYGRNDDGNGYLRQLILRHDHEKRVGHTSSIKKEVIGIKNNKLINYSAGIDASWENIVRISDKVINLVDLPGNKKYIKTLLFGLAAYKFDALIIMMDITCVEKDTLTMYRGICDALKLPHLVVFSKADCINDSHKNTIIDETIISNVSGEGIDKIIGFMNIIKKNTKKIATSDLSLFSILETYFVPDVGTIFSGIMYGGVLENGLTVYLMNGGECVCTKIKYIKKKQIDSQFLFEGETGSIELAIGNDQQVDKNMVIVTKKCRGYNRVLFKVVQILSQGQVKQASLYVGNQIAIVTVSFGDDVMILDVQHNPIILPFMEFEDVYGFVRGDSGLLCAGFVVGGDVF